MQHFLTDAINLIRNKLWHLGTIWSWPKLFFWNRFVSNLQVSMDIVMVRRRCLECEERTKGNEYGWNCVNDTEIWDVRRWNQVENWRPTVKNYLVLSVVILNSRSKWWMTILNQFLLLLVRIIDGHDNWSMIIEHKFGVYCISIARIYKLCFKL